MRAVIFNLSLLLFCSCIRFSQSEPITEVSLEGTENTITDKMSLSELASDPEKWESKYVEIEGYYRAAFEECALYASSTNEKSKDAIWLNFEERLSAKMPDDSKYTGKKVRIKGRVSLRKGHLMQYAATVESIYYIALIE